MLDARWAKVAAELWDNKTRTLLVALSIALGVLCIGMVTGARSIILQGLSAEYAAARPAAATLTVSPFGNALLRQVQRAPDVRLAEGRYSVNARLHLAGGTWQDLVLFAIPDFRHMRLNKVWPDRGAWPPPPHQILLERNSLATLGGRVGDAVQVELPDGTQRTLRVAGTTHDINQPATAVFGINYGYVTFATLAWLGERPAYNQLDLAVTGNSRDTAHIWRVVSAVRRLVQGSGRAVLATAVPTPGKLWVYDAVQSMLLLLTVLGVFSLGMSGFLVVNTVTSQITQQTNQIGIMKAVGGSSRQLASIYLATILGFCLVALLIAIPLGVAGARGLIVYATGLLDFDTHGLGFSLQILAFEVLAGVAVPLLAALVPIVAGSRITVRQALASYGTGGRGDGELPLEGGARWLDRIPRPMLLSLANTVRRRGRLILTLSAMILGGAIFIAVLSVRASLLLTLDDVFGYRNYDVQITFSRPYPAAAVERVARRVPGLIKQEGWAQVIAQRAGATGAAGADVTLVAPPAGSTFIKPVVLQGRWLRPGDQRAIVVNSDVLKNQPDLHPGQAVAFTSQGHTARWRVVGVVRGVQAGPIAYVPYNALARSLGQSGQIGRLQAVTRQHDGPYEAQVARALEVRLKHAGFWIDSTQTTVGQRAILAANFDSIVSFLLAMALLLGVVGGLGLMGTMSINVLERTREIGIMRAIGASDRDLLVIVLLEGAVIAALSWVIGAALAVPLSPFLSGVVGRNFVNAPLHDTFSLGGALLWLAGVLVIAVLAGFVPAWRASRLTVRDVLAYE